MPSTCSGRQLAECDTQIEARLQRLQAYEREPARGKKRSKVGNAPKFDLCQRLFQVSRVDLTRIDGIDATTALVVLSEVGADVSKFPSDKHFASWMNLCPGTKITGGKVMSGKTRRSADSATVRVQKLGSKPSGPASVRLMVCWSTTTITKDEFDALVECGILVHGSARRCITGLGEQQRAAHDWGPALVDR